MALGSRKGSCKQKGYEGGELHCFDEPIGVGKGSTFILFNATLSLP